MASNVLDSKALDAGLTALRRARYSDAQPLDGPFAEGVRAYLAALPAPAVPVATEPACEFDPRTAASDLNNLANKYRRFVVEQTGETCETDGEGRHTCCHCREMAFADEMSMIAERFIVPVATEPVAWAWRHRKRTNRPWTIGVRRPILEEDYEVLPLYPAPRPREEGTE